ncbi:EpsG family protein [Pediococcus pentosaceus]|uniref:EpsG family protein n=1 Tax=Pediococcus pentosaceus TaxID=1255 RepID=UPI00398B12A8
MIYVWMMICATLLAFLSREAQLLTYDSGEIGRNTKKNLLSKMLFFLSYLFIFIPGAIRYYVGTDYTGYSLHQIPAVLARMPAKVELLYRYVIFIGDWLGKNTTYQYIFVITNFLIVTFLYIYIAQQSRLRELSIFIFVCGGFFAFSLSGMRQSIAVVIFLYATKYIKSRKLIKYALFILIATLFHTSAVIYFLFYFIVNIKFSPVVVILLMTVLKISANSVRTILIIVLSKFNLYADYFGGRFDTGGFNLLMVILVLSMMIIVMGAYFVFPKKQFNQYNVEINVHYMACIVISIINVLPTPSRTLFLLVPIYITLIPNLISEIEDKKMKYILYICVIIFFSVFFYKNVIEGNAYEILPYRDIWGIFG